MKPEKYFSCIVCGKYDKWLSSRTFGLHSEASQAKFDKPITIQFGIQCCIVIGYLALLICHTWYNQWDWNIFEPS